MFRKMILLCTLSLLLAIDLYAGDLPSHIIKITEQSEVTDFKKLDNALDDLTNSVSACVDSGKSDYETCSCQFPEKLEVLQLTIDEVTAKYPSWGVEGKGLYYYDREQNQSSNIFISTISTHLIEQCK